MRFVFAVLLIISFAFAAKIDDKVLNILSLKGEANIFLEFKERLDLNKLSKEKGEFDNMEEIYRGRLIMNSLMEVATRTQKNVISFLNRDNIKHESFWIDNKIAIFGCPGKSVIQLSTLFPEISEIIEITEVQLDLETPLKNVRTSELMQNDIEVGVQWVKAPNVWSKFNGTGIILANSDTGSIIHKDFEHTYRGHGGEHHYNWFDALQTRAAPYDDHGHGTHCMGTKVGTSATVKVGVSPGSKWIVCKWLNAGGGGNAAGALKCLQFFLAPTKTDGTSPNPDLRPHVTSHSYRCQCQLENAVNALVSAGVEVVVAAGNSGPRCSTVTEPGSFQNAFAVGALNRGADTIATFSSKGPSANRLKPEISAPGVNVRSTASRGGYVSMSGTSMACPHVAGVVALFWSGHPSLVRQIQKTREILEKSAKKQTTTECNGNGQTPNNVFGHGTIDVEKASTMAKSLGY